MAEKSKVILGLSGICVFAMGVSAVTSQFGGDMEINTEGGLYTSDARISVNSDMLNSPMSERQSAPDDVTCDQCGDIGIKVSFTGVPDEKRSSKSELVFVSDSPRTVIIVPVEREYSVTEEYRVVGYIETVMDNVLCLNDCEIEMVFGRNELPESTSDSEISSVPARSPITERTPSVTRETTSTQRTESIAQDPIPDDIEKSETVYVSATGKYHSKATCSGMKSYTEMSRIQAESDGKQPCRKCYK